MDNNCTWKEDFWKVTQMMKTGHSWFLYQMFITPAPLRSLECCNHSKLSKLPSALQRTLDQFAAWSFEPDRLLFQVEHVSGKSLSFSHYFKWKVFTLDRKHHLYAMQNHYELYSRRHHEKLLRRENATQFLTWQLLHLELWNSTPGLLCDS